MKKIILTAISFVFTVSFCQNNQGTIKYSESTNNKIFIDDINESIDSSMDKQLESNGMAEMIKAQILKEMSKNGIKQKQLIFRNNISIYKEYKNDELTQGDLESSSIMISINGQSDNEIKYIDNIKKEKILQKEFMGKKFLIKEKISSIKWKLTNERTKILDYSCIKAIRIDSNLKTEVWFTSQIPISSGPDGINGLPGMILSYKLSRITTSQDSERSEEEIILTIQATSIDLTPIDEKSINMPKKGKVLESEEEYNSLIEKAMQNMSRSNGRDGNTIIIR